MVKKLSLEQQIAHIKGLPISKGQIKILIKEARIKDAKRSMIIQRALSRVTHKIYKRDPTPTRKKLMEQSFAQFDKAAKHYGRKAKIPLSDLAREYRVAVDSP